MSTICTYYRARQTANKELAGVYGAPHAVLCGDTAMQDRIQETKKVTSTKQLHEVLAGIPSEIRYRDLYLDRVIQENTCYMLYRAETTEYLTTINVNAFRDTDELQNELNKYAN